MANAKQSSKNKAVRNAIPISKAQASAFKAAKQQTQERLLAEAQAINSEANLFQAEVKSARPLNIDVPFTEKTYPKPIAKQFIRDEKQALRDSLSDEIGRAHV